jgi:glycine cleavage system H protein
MGITTTMVELIAEPYHISLSEVGSTIARGDAFGTVGGYKLIVDVLSPVSGEVITNNYALVFLGTQGLPLDPLIYDPYNGGWMVVVKLSNLNELQSLLSAQSYFALVTTKK